MTILDGDGVYGASAAAPMKAPKGILARTDQAPALGELGHQIIVNSNAGTTINTGSYQTLLTYTVAQAGWYEVTASYYLIGGAQTTGFTWKLNTPNNLTYYGLDFGGKTFAAAVNGQTDSNNTGKKCVFLNANDVITFQIQATGGALTAYGTMTLTAQA